MADAMTQDPDRFSISARLRSFRYASEGLRFMLESQHNARLHLAAALAAVLLGWLLEIDASDWKWLVLTVAMVWFAEAMNTAFEHLCNVVSPEFHPEVKKAKDVAAAAVLLTAVAAVIEACLIFLPYLLG